LRTRTLRGLVVFATLATMLPASGPAHASFPGENGKIAFDHAGIETINPDGSGRATVPVPEHANRPAWSPDGTKLAFECFADVVRSICTSNADGSGLSHVATVDGNSRPSWSPDGNRIVFEASDPCDPRSVPCPEHSLWAVNADGSGLTEVLSADNGLEETEPAWSPDGSTIAFTGAPYYGQEGTSGIYFVSPDGSNPRLVIPGGYFPQWSPDGHRLAFGCNDLLCSANADGSDVQQLIDAGINGYVRDAAWSPDGTRIAFMLLQKFSCPFPAFCDSDLYTMNTDGSDQTNVTQTPNAYEDYADWQPLAFKNASKKCKAFPGDYQNHGQCLKASK
jgi:Tol biopolymer transport system component